MSVSVFPIPASGGSGGSAGFLVQMGDATNTTTVLDTVYPAGGYEITLGTEDASFDIYGLDEAGNLSGYTNAGSVVFTSAVASIVIYGSVSNQIYTFAFAGASSQPSSSGSSSGAGAYITAADPLDLPNNNDATVITGGNFDGDLTVSFLGTDGEAHPAKSVTVISSTSASVVRPDNQVNDHAPYTLVVKNADTPEPTGTNVHKLVDAITFGQDPVWVTNTYLTPFYTVGNSYSAFVEATDPELGNVTYSVVGGLLPEGFSLDATTGEVAGITTLTETRLITFRATDQGGNYKDRELLVGYAGSFPTSTPPPATKTESFSYNFVATIADEINHIAVDYTLDGWTLNGDLKPVLTVIRGEKYALELSSSGHPFFLQTNTPPPYNAASIYTTGVANSGIQVGTIQWTVDASAPNTLYYVDSNDNTNYGTINVVDQPTPAIGQPVYSVVSGQLPSGLSLSTAGNLNGTATVFGDFTFTVRATFTQQSYVEAEVNFTVYDIAILTFTSSQSWTAPGTFSATCLVIGGGGGGGSVTNQYIAHAAGGNAGSVRRQSGSFTSGVSYSISVGAGGNGVSGFSNAPAGGTSQISGTGVSISASGGAGGEGNSAPSGSVTYVDTILGISTSYAADIPNNTFDRGAAGAGGAPVQTVSANAGSSGNSGIGVTIGGIQYAGGGGNEGGYYGGYWSASYGGGSGSASGQANRGGGGGGNFNAGSSGSGGSGVVVISYPIIP